MTRKHFRKLAEALKSAKASDELIEAIAYVCKSENPRFNFQTFREACKEAKQYGQLFYSWWLFTFLSRRGEVKRGKYAPFLCLIDRRGEKGGYIQTYLDVFIAIFSCIQLYLVYIFSISRHISIYPYSILQGRYKAFASLTLKNLNVNKLTGLYRIGISRQ